MGDVLQRKIRFPISGQCEKKVGGDTCSLPRDGSKIEEDCDEKLIVDILLTMRREEGRKKGRMQETRL